MKKKKHRTKEVSNLRNLLRKKRSIYEIENTDNTKTDNEQICDILQNTSYHVDRIIKDAKRNQIVSNLSNGRTPCTVDEYIDKVNSENLHKKHSNEILETLNKNTPVEMWKSYKNALQRFGYNDDCFDI